VLMLLRYHEIIVWSEFTPGYFFGGGGVFVFVG